MSSMLQRMFGSAAGTATRAPAATAPAALRFYLHRARWHLDGSTPQTLVLLHGGDAAADGRAWERFLACLQRLPQRGLTPTAPLDIYCPDLPGHGRTAAAAASSPPLADLVARAWAVRAFADTVESPGIVHLVGAGHTGAQLAALAALAPVDVARGVTGRAQIRSVAVLARPSAATPIASSKPAAADAAADSCDALLAKLGAWQPFGGAAYVDGALRSHASGLVAAHAAAFPKAAPLNLPAGDGAAADDDTALRVLQALDLIGEVPQSA